MTVDSDDNILTANQPTRTDKVNHISWTIALTMVFTLIYIVTLGYLDYEVISPTFLPDDICYYHEHEAPLLIDIFYIGAGGHTEPPYSPYHMLTLLLTSILLAYWTARRLTKRKMNKKTAHNKC